MTDLGIVIVNYKTKALLRDCLQSIDDSRGELRVSTCVVDNASNDGSAEMVRTEFPHVHLIVQEKNEGYAHANNLGLHYLGMRNEAGASPADSTPRYLLLLNPDILLPPDALAEMVAFMDAHPECGAAGPKLVRQDGKLDRACRRSFPTPEVSFYRLTGLSFLFKGHPRFGRYNMSYLPDTVTTEVDSVVGAFMMMRREALAEAGLLDEAFFMYGEDLDLAYRIKEAGWQIWYYADVTVLHYKGESSRQRSRASIINFYDAMAIFHRKHYEAKTFMPLNLLIKSGIWGLCGFNLVRNSLRPQAKRGVASATHNA